jgi:hypothetical protein
MITVIAAEERAHSWYERYGKAKERFDQGKLSLDEFQSRMFNLTEKTYGSDLLIRKAEAIRTQTAAHVEQMKRILAKAAA